MLELAGWAGADGGFKEVCLSLLPSMGHYSYCRKSVLPNARVLGQVYQRAVVDYADNLVSDHETL